MEDLSEEHRRLLTKASWTLTSISAALFFISLIVVQALGSRDVAQSWLADFPRNAIHLGYWLAFISAICSGFGLSTARPASMAFALVVWFCEFAITHTV